LAYDGCYQSPDRHAFVTGHILETTMTKMTYLRLTALGLMTSVTLGGVAITSPANAADTPPPAHHVSKQHVKKVTLAEKRAKQHMKKQLKHKVLVKTHGPAGSTQDNTKSEIPR
jgi:hypothetical protein